MSDWQQIGPHLIAVEGDILYVRARGAIDVPELLWMIDRCDEVVDRYGYVITLSDATEGTTMTPEARQCQAEFSRQHRDRLTVSILFGVNRVASVLINLIARALKMTIGFDMRLIFARDEADALLHVSRERARLAALAEARLKMSSRSHRSLSSTSPSPRS